MRIEFFGRIAAAFGGAADIAVPESGLDVATLRRLLADRFETSAILERTVRAAVNEEIVVENYVVFPRDTVEFMSPLSGG